jgi:hypothetical protein
VVEDAAAHDAAADHDDLVAILHAGGAFRGRGRRSISPLLRGEMTWGRTTWHHTGVDMASLMMP